MTQHLQFICIQWSEHDCHGNLSGTWETKVSNREKRQQRQKDKAPGDGSGSPVATTASSAISTLEEVQTAPEEPETTITTTVSTPPIQREVEGMYTAVIIFMVHNRWMYNRGIKIIIFFLLFSWPT